MAFVVRPLLPPQGPITVSIPPLSQHGGSGSQSGMREVHDACQEGQIQPCNSQNAGMCNISTSFCYFQVTGFSNKEEEDVGATKAMPFLLEDRLREEGGEYSAMDNWHPHVVTDGKLITGQNPQSSEAVGEAVADVVLGSLEAGDVTIGSNAPKRAAGGGNEYLSGVADGVTLEDPNELARTAPNRDFKANEKSVTQT